MSKPNLQIDVLPSKNGKVYYLPLGAKVEGAKERLKVAFVCRSSTSIARIRI